MNTTTTATVTRLIRLIRRKGDFGIQSLRVIILILFFTPHSNILATVPSPEAYTRTFNTYIPVGQYTFCIVLLTGASLRFSYLVKCPTVRLVFTRAGCNVRNNMLIWKRSVGRIILNTCSCTITFVGYRLYTVPHCCNTVHAAIVVVGRKSATKVQVQLYELSEELSMGGDSHRSNRVRPTNIVLA